MRGDLATDHMDQQIPRMNHLVWAEDINDPHARILKARYYGEISYIDDCLGRILDAVDSREDADDTLLCFFSDHGDHLGDHHAWQKESFFEASAHVPFLVSWPARITADRRCAELVCLTDLFGIATTAAGRPQLRDGIDALGVLDGSATTSRRCRSSRGCGEASGSTSSTGRAALPASPSTPQTCSAAGESRYGSSCLRA